MKRVQSLVAGVLIAVAPVLAADRLTDRDVKALVSRIEEGRDRFDDAFDDELKRRIVRGPGGEVNVGQFFNDFQENIDRVEERLKPEYAASAEVTTLLRQASDINRFFRQLPAGTKGESEWNRLARDLKTLAVAYGADFPLADGAIVRRIGDGELAGIADEIGRSAGRLKRSLDDDLENDPAIGKPARDAIVQEADALSKAAKALRSRVKDGKPSSAEADRVVNCAARLRAFIASHQVRSASAIWAAITPRIETLAGAYGTTAITASR